MREQRKKPILTKTYDQHSTNWAKNGAYSNVRLVNVDICDGIVPNKELWQSQLHKKNEMREREAQKANTQ